MPNKAPDQTTTRTIVRAVVVLFTCSLAAVVALTIFVDDSGTESALVGAVFTNLAAIAAVLVNVQRTNAVGAQVDQVATHTEALTNGLLDAKVRTAVAEVMRPDLVDPEARDQLAADLVKRDAYDAATTLLRNRADQ